MLVIYKHLLTCLLFDVEGRYTLNSGIGNRRFGTVCSLWLQFVRGML
jgi:hypothetical protein